MREISRDLERFREIRREREREREREGGREKEYISGVSPDIRMIHYENLGENIRRVTRDYQERLGFRD